MPDAKLQPGQRIPVTVCAIPYELTRIEGGALFSCKSGFWGCSSRIVFEFGSNYLWQLTQFEDSGGSVPLCHLVKMKALLAEHICADHEDLP